MKAVILQYLANLPKDMGMTERVLRVELTPRLRDMPGEGDLQFALQEMKRDEWVSTTKNLITQDTLWLITEKGREILSQA